MAIENLQPLAYAVATFAFALGTCSIFLRLYCRWRLQTFGWDDGMAVLLFVSISNMHSNHASRAYTNVSHCVSSSMECSTLLCTFSCTMDLESEWYPLSLLLCDCGILTGDRHLNELPDGQLQKVTKVRKSAPGMYSSGLTIKHSGCSSRRFTGCSFIGSSSKRFSCSISGCRLREAFRSPSTSQWASTPPLPSSTGCWGSCNADRWTP